MPNYIVKEAGFFYGMYYAEGDVLNLLDVQAKYDVLHGSLVLADPETYEGGQSALAAAAITPVISARPKAPPRTIRF